MTGDAPLSRGCALACAPCSSAGPAAASAAPVRRTLRRSISLSSAVGCLTISPSIRVAALRLLDIEAWLWSPVKETGPRGHEGCKNLTRLRVGALQTFDRRQSKLPALTSFSVQLKKPRRQLLRKR